MSTAAKAPAKPKVDATGWSRRSAYPGDEVFLVARLSGFLPGTEVKFSVFPASGDPGKPIAKLAGKSDEGGLAWAQWAFEPGGQKLKDPNLVFEAEAGGQKQLSPALTISDWVLFDLADENKKPLAGKEVRIVDSLGVLHVVPANARGQVRLDKVPMGDLRLAVRGYEVIGESKPGEKAYSSGKQHNLDLREMKFAVEIESPKAGSVFLAGEKVPVKTKVTRLGQPWEGSAKVTANNGARVLGGQDAGQNASSESGGTFVVLPAKDGVVELSAKFDSALTTVALKVVRPVVAGIVFEGADAHKVYDNKKKDLAQSYAKWNDQGDMVDTLPGAFTMGKKLTAKVKLRTSEALTKPVHIDLALSTPPVEEGLPPAPNERRAAPKGITLRLPADKREAGVEFKGGEAGVELTLESDRPLPFSIGSFQWNVEARLNVKKDGAWAMSPANAPVWPKLGDLRALRLTTVWGPPAIAEGKELDPGTTPLKKSEYDPFHIRRAAEWAAGGFNLLMDHERSIPKLVAASAKLFRWPDDYHWLRGKAKAEHPRPLSAAEREEEEGDPTKAGNKPTAKNWGWGVVDNPTHPGGQPKQWASLWASVLATLGVKSKILYLRPRGEGAINTVAHDPVTRGAKCHDPRRDWGKPYLAFLGIDPDKSRDGDAKGTKLHEDATFVIEAVSKKAAPHAEAATTTHELKPNDPAHLLSGTCKCGVPYAQVTKMHFTGTLTFGLNRGQYVLGEQTLKLAQGEVSVELAIPSTLYGTDSLLPNPYGGALTLTGGGKNIVKQLAGVSFKKEPGLLKGKIDVGEVPAGEYRMGLTAFFQRIQHHKAFIDAIFNGAGDVTVTAVAPGAPRPETTVDAVHNVGGGAIGVKSSGKLAAMLVEGMFRYRGRGPRRSMIWKEGPITSLLVSVDGKVGRPLPRGQLVELGPVPAGDHKLTFSNPNASESWSARVRVVATTVDDKARVRANPISGAQPDWGYKSAKTGKPVAEAAGKDDAGNPLKAPFIESIIYLCPNCKKTVHDGDAECWHCAAKLTARKASERFGQPGAVTASGGESQGGGAGKPGAK
jgi:hypothetical protein